MIFVATVVPDPSAPTLSTQAPSGDRLWLLDYGGVMKTGPVVPQSLWFLRSVTDFRQYVLEARLQLPIFFTQENGVLGLSLDDAAHGRYQTLHDASMAAPLGGRYTTYVRISVCGRWPRVPAWDWFWRCWVYISGQVTTNLEDKYRPETKHLLKTQSPLESLHIISVALWLDSFKCVCHVEFTYVPPQLNYTLTMTGSEAQ